MQLFYTQFEVDDDLPCPNQSIAIRVKSTFCVVFPFFKYKKRIVMTPML